MVGRAHHNAHCQGLSCPYHNYVLTSLKTLSNHQVNKIRYGGNNDEHPFPLSLFQLIPFFTSEWLNSNPPTLWRLWYKDGTPVWRASFALHTPPHLTPLICGSISQGIIILRETPNFTSLPKSSFNKHNHMGVLQQKSKSNLHQM